MTGSTSHNCYDYVRGGALGAVVAVFGMMCLGFPIPIVVWINVAVAVGLAIWIMLFEDKRWKYCDPVTKLVRVCFFWPRRLVQFYWWLVKWAFTGFKPLEYAADDDSPGLKFSRLETLEHLRTISNSMADFDCQSYSTGDEWLDKLRIKA